MHSDEAGETPLLNKRVRFDRVRSARAKPRAEAYLNPAVYLERLRSMGWSQSKLAEAVGVNRNTVAQWVAGTRRPNENSRAFLAAVLKVPEKDLFGPKPLDRSYKSDHMEAFPFFDVDKVDTVMSQRGMSYGDVGRAAGMSRMNAWAYLTGRKRARNPATRDRLLSALGMTYGDAMDLEPLTAQLDTRKDFQEPVRSRRSLARNLSVLKIIPEEEIGRHLPLEPEERAAQIPCGCAVVTRGFEGNLAELDAVRTHYTDHLRRLMSQRGLVGEPRHTYTTTLSPRARRILPTTRPELDFRH